MNEWFFFVVHTHRDKLQPECKTDFVKEESCPVMMGHVETDADALVLTDREYLQAGVKNTSLLVATGPADFLSKMKHITTNSAALKLDGVRKFMSVFLHWTKKDIWEIK